MSGQSRDDLRPSEPVSSRPFARSFFNVRYKRIAVIGIVCTYGSNIRLGVIRGCGCISGNRREVDFNLNKLWSVPKYRPVPVG